MQELSEFRFWGYAAYYVLLIVAKNVVIRFWGYALYHTEPPWRFRTNPCGIPYALLVCSWRDSCNFLWNYDEDDEEEDEDEDQVGGGGDGSQHTEALSRRKEFVLRLPERSPDNHAQFY